MGLIRTPTGWRSEQAVVNDQLLQDHFDIQPEPPIIEGGAQ